MIISNVKSSGRLKSIVIDGSVISSIEANQKGDLDAEGCRVIPGLIDLHIHGCAGFDTMDGDFAPMCRMLAERGTTSWLPTTMTADAESLRRITSSLTQVDGAQILGFHLEGPFVSKQFKGAQNEAFIRPADYDEFRSYNDVKMITVAPETEGCIEFIKKASDRCVVSLGHTAATFSEAKEAFESGAQCVTHLYNAMTPFHHRETGVIGAAFLLGGYAQIICDGLHVSREAFLTAYRMIGCDRLVLIRDAIRPAGLPDGQYESGGLRVTLRDGQARLDNGVLAGSCSMLMDCVKKAISFGVPFDEAVRMATYTPARLLGINKGVISEGYDADLLIVDDKLNIKKVIIGGKVFD